MGLLKKVGSVLGFGTDNRVSNEVTPIDPRLKEISRQQSERASQFRSNLPNFTKDKFNMESAQRKNEAAGQIQQGRADASSRGLLFSGIQQGRELGAQGGLASTLARRRQEINQEGQDQANQMEMQAINTGMGVLGQETGINKQYYDIDEDRRDRKAAILSKGAQAAGSSAGMAGGGK
jgi:hypothetical protein